MTECPECHGTGKIGYLCSHENKRDIHLQCPDCEENNFIVINCENCNEIGKVESSSEKLL